MNRRIIAFTTFSIIFAVSSSLSYGQIGATSLIPDEPQAGNYSDAQMALLEATWAQNQDEMISSLQTDFPDVFDMTSSATDWAQANPVPTVALAVTTVASVNYGMSDLLEEYGNDVGIDTITYSVPLTPIYDGPVYPFVFLIEVSVGGTVQNSANDPTVYTPTISLNY